MCINAQDTILIFGAACKGLSATQADGALTQLYASVTENIVNGGYYVPVGKAPETMQSPPSHI